MLSQIYEIMFTNSVNCIVVISWISLKQNVLTELSAEEISQYLKMIAASSLSFPFSSYGNKNLTCYTFQTFFGCLHPSFATPQEGRNRPPSFEMIETKLSNIECLRVLFSNEHTSRFLLV